MCIQVLILPGRQIKCTTRTVRSNCNPLFNQSFELDVSSLNLNKAEISLMVRDRPEQSRYERCVTRSVTLGQAKISLAELGELNNRRLVRWCLLEDESSVGSPHSDIMVMLLSYRSNDSFIVNRNKKRDIFP